MRTERRVIRLGLGAKFTLTVLTILACTMAANTLYSVYASTRFHEKQLLERGRALGRLISLVSPEAILGFDFLLLNDYTRQVSAQPDVVYGVILSPKGSPLSAYIDDSDPFVRARINATGSTDVTRLLQELDRQPELIRLEFPIVHNGAELGRFLVGMSKEPLHAESRRQLALQIIALTALVCVSRAELGGFLLYRVLRRAKDARFDAVRGNVVAFLVFWVFQMVWVWGVSLPVLFVNGEPAGGGGEIVGVRAHELAADRMLLG